MSNKTGQFGLTQSVIKQINSVFKLSKKIEQVVIYGSRAKGNYRLGSDIDITIKGNDLNLNDLAKLSYNLDELLLPYTFDLSIYNEIDNQNLIEHIKRVGKIFYEKA